MNDGKDSIVANSCIIGNYAKDGMWVYVEVVMTHYPEQPLMQYFRHIQRISPDTLMVSEYKAKEKENQYIGCYQKEKVRLNKEDLEQSDCPWTVVKETQTRFRVPAFECEEWYKDEMVWMNKEITYTPAQYKAEIKVYDKSEEERLATSDEPEQHSILYYKRLARNPLVEE